MAHRKAGGTAKNLHDSKPKYLGIKRADGQAVKTGEIIVRQRGSRILAGTNVGTGSDYTLFARTDGKVSFGEKRKIKFDGTKHKKKFVEIKK
jgi:large subunit ribosomal protein L27